MTGKRLLAGVAITAVVATASAGAVGEAAKKRPPSQAAVAKQLAKRVTSARTPAARYGALLAVMRALRVGVYTGRGRVIVRGAERSTRDFFLYDFDLKAVAGALARNETADLESLSGRLAAVGVARAGSPLPLIELQRIVASGTRRARARPSNRRSLLPLLVRELGLRKQPRYDLAQGIPASAHFDSLQTLLLLADATVGGHERSSRLAASAGAALARPCGVLGPSGNAHVFLGTLSWPTSETSAADKVVAFHALVLYPALTVESITPVGKYSTHYGPPGHDPDAGKPLRFQARIVMTIDTSQTEITCGPLRAQKLPPKGPVPGIAVTWKSALEAPGGRRTVLGEHGGWSADLASDENGLVTFDFAPKGEAVPGFGRERTADGYVGFRLEIPLEVPEPVRQHLQSSGLFSYNWPVSIGYHKPRGFRFEGLKLHQEAGPGVGQHLVEVDLAVSGRVCGDDPYAMPWALKLHQTLRTRGWDRGRLVHDETGETDLTTELKLVTGGTLLPAVDQGSPLVIYTGRIAFEPTPSPTLVVNAIGIPEPYRPREQTVSVPIEEDTSCPEND